MYKHYKMEEQQTPVLDEATEEILQKWLSMSREELKEMEPLPYDYSNEYLEEMRKQNHINQELLGQAKMFNKNFASLVVLIGLSIIYVCTKK